MLVLIILWDYENKDKGFVMVVKEEMHPLDIALQFCINGNPTESENILKSLPNNDPRVLFNLGWHEMRHGNLKKGFEYMNCGRFINVFGLPALPGKIWKDESLENKTLLFRCEGGYGDQILNFRFAKRFQEMGARVLVSCAPELKALFSRHGFICVDNEVIMCAHYDYWVPAMSAAYVLDIEYDKLDGSAYIFPNNPLNLFSNEKKLKVGIRWSGNPEFEHEQHRRFPPELMIDLHNTSNTTFYSLQRDSNTKNGLPFSDMADKMKSWDDTANIIAGLDLVITSCTSIAHLAAAMGIPTWIVVPIMPYYTWSYPGDKSFWYNSVTLFRQEEYGNWDKPFDDIKKELIKLANNKTFL
jgi:hypothetical protein